MSKKKTIIEWINIKDHKPRESGWYMTVCMPINYEDFKDNPSEMNEWIAKYGIDKTWFIDGDFFSRRDYERTSKEITDRIIFWSEIPEVPML